MTTLGVRRPSTYHGGSYDFNGQRHDLLVAQQVNPGTTVTLSPPSPQIAGQACGGYHCSYVAQAPEAGVGS